MYGTMYFLLLLFYSAEAEHFSRTSSSDVKVVDPIFLYNTSVALCNCCHRDSGMLMMYISAFSEFYLIFFYIYNQMY